MSWSMVALIAHWIPAREIERGPEMIERHCQEVVKTVVSCVKEWRRSWVALSALRSLRDWIVNTIYSDI
jgi:hypothetical protein